MSSALHAPHSPLPDPRLRPVLWRLGFPQGSLGVLAGADRRVASFARRLARNFESWPPRSVTQLERLCHELLAGIFQDTLRRVRPPGWLKIVRDALANRYGEPLRIGDLADDAAVHPVHLIRSFHRF